MKTALMAGSRKKRLHLLTTAVFFVAATLILVSPVMAALHGDVNSDGSIDVQDVALTMRHALGLETLNDLQGFLADVNGDGIVNVQDVSQVMQKSLGLIDSFTDAPIPETDLVDDFISAPGLSPGTKMIVVTLAVENQEQYRVFIGSKTLYYSESVEGFLGEVPEDDALIENVIVYKK